MLAAVVTVAARGIATYSFFVPMATAWKALSLGFCLVLITRPGAVDAAPPPEASLNLVVITAPLVPRTADDALASVTVIEEAELRRQHPTSMSDLLRAQPGVDVSTQGSYGQQTSLFMRGTGSNASLLLIDGIRLRSATTGAAAWAFLDPGLFEGVDIVRGPRGSLYGADAVGGVIQLFTADAEQDGVTPSASLGVGRFNTRRATASLSGRHQGTRYTLAGTHVSTEGEPVRTGGDDKGHDNTSGLIKLGHRFESGLDLGLLTLQSRGESEFEGPGPATDDVVQQVAGAYAELPLTSHWRSRVTLSEARDERDTKTTTYASRFETRTRTAHWQNTFSLGRHELVVGAEYLEDDLGDSKASDLPYQRQRRVNQAVFAQGRINRHPLTAQLSLRHDDNDAVGHQVTGSLAVGMALDEQHRARASFGTAFRAPTFNELYFPFEGASNPDLNAESSRSLELGMRGQYRAWFWDAAVYHTDMDDLIALDDSFRPINLERARVQGAELSLGAALGSWQLAAALTYTDPESVRGLHRGKQLARRARQALRLDVDRRLGDWSLGGAWIAQNHRYNDAANQQRLPGHGQLNLRANWRLAPLWSLRLKVDNALDSTFITAQGQAFDPVTSEASSFGYLNAGRAGWVSLHYGQ